MRGISDDCLPLWSLSDLRKALHKTDDAMTAGR